MVDGTDADDGADEGADDAGEAVAERAGMPSGEGGSGEAGADMMISQWRACCIWKSTIAKGLLEGCGCGKKSLRRRVEGRS